MDICRICLSTSVFKDLNEIIVSLKDMTVTGVEMLDSCLNIQICNSLDMKTPKLCCDCCDKLISFYKFKLLAAESSLFFLSIENKSNLESDELKYSEEVKTEPQWEILEIIKHEAFVKKEENVNCGTDIDNNDIFQESDDEFLSVWKKSKFTSDKKKKKRGRPKKTIIKGEPSKLCDLCGKAIRDLKQHMLKHLPESCRKRIPCKSCTKTFASYSARYRHYKIKHLGIKSRCDLCNKYVVCLKSHKLLIHNAENLPYHCAMCNRTFISQGVLNNHVLIHTKLKPFECTQCDAKFRTKIVMLDHVRRIHEQEKTHLCQYCSKGFFKKYHLQNHLRRHTKEKPHKCTECGKGFATTSQRKNHQIIHSGIKMFTCNYCDMTFYTKSALKTHMISHTKEKKYDCKYCGMKFGRSDHCNRHQRTLHEKHLTIN